RQGALCDTYGPSLGGLAPDAAAATAPRPRPVLVADEVSTLPHQGRIAARAEIAAPGDADRFQPPGASEALRGRAETASGRRLGSHRPLRRRKRARGRC